MRRQILTWQVLVLIGGIPGPWLHAQPPPERVTVTGTVRDRRTEQPVVGVTVTLTPQPGGEEVVVLKGGQATTDEEGQFTLKDVTEGWYTLLLSAQGYQPFSQKLKVAFRMEPLALTIQHPPWIRGQLRGADGVPLTHIHLQVHLTPSVGGGGQQVPAVTDGEGFYEVQVRQTGQYFLTVIVPNVGYAQSGELTVDRDLEGVDLQLSPGASVAGQVRLRGLKNLPGQVNVTFEEKRGSFTLNRYMLAPDGEGRFAFPNFPPGTYQVEAQGDFHGHPQTLTLTEGQAVTDLVLKIGPVVSGRILAPDGTPLANASVSFDLVRFKPFTERDTMFFITDGEGRYGVLVQYPGQYFLTVVVPNMGCARSEELTVATEDVEGVDLRLTPTASVAGRVRIWGTEQLPRRVTLLFEEQKEPIPLIFRSLGTDEQGRFGLRDLPAGTYQVRVYDEEYLPTPPQTLTLAEGQAVTDFVLEVVPFPVVSVRLLAPDGTPLAGREVVFQGYTQREGGYSSTGIWTRLKLDANSGFAVRVPGLGLTQMHLWLASVGYLRQDLEIREKEDIQALEWRLKPFATVVGQVREKRTGEPLAGVQVSLWRQESGLGFPVPWPQATSDADGRFALKDVVPGNYRVRVTAEGYRPAVGRRIRVPEDAAPEELLIELESGTPVQGRVLEPDETTLTVEE